MGVSHVCASLKVGLLGNVWRVSLCVCVCVCWCVCLVVCVYVSVCWCVYVWWSVCMFVLVHVDLCTECSPVVLFLHAPVHVVSAFVLACVVMSLFPIPSWLPLPCPIQRACTSLLPMSWWIYLRTRGHACTLIHVPTSPPLKPSAPLRRRFLQSTSNWWRRLVEVSLCV